MDAKVCWITGGSTLRQRAIKEILSQIGEHELYVFDENASGEYVYETMNSMDIFDMMSSDSMQVYVMNGIPTFDGSTKSSNKKLVDILENLAENQLVIINGTDYKYKKAIHTVVKKIGKIIDMADSISKKDAPSFLNIEFNRIEKKIEDEDMKFLLEYLGTGDTPKYSADYLCNIAYKFKHYLGKKKTITKDDIVSVCNVDRKSVVWDLMDALDQRDFNTALSVFENIHRTKRDLRSTVEGILYPMMWKYRLLMYVKECEKEKLNFNQILERVSLLVKNNEEKTKIYSDGFVRKVIQGFYGQAPIINLYSRNRLYKIYKGMTFHMNNMRFYTDSELRLMITALFLVICEEVDFDSLKNINRLFTCNKVCNVL